MQRCTTRNEARRLILLRIQAMKLMAPTGATEELDGDVLFYWFLPDGDTVVLQVLLDSGPNKTVGYALSSQSHASGYGDVAPVMEALAQLLLPFRVWPTCPSHDCSTNR